MILAVRRCDELVSNLYVCYMIPAWLDNIFLFYLIIQMALLVLVSKCHKPAQLLETSWFLLMFIEL